MLLSRIRGCPERGTGDLMGILIVPEDSTGSFFLALGQRKLFLALGLKQINSLTMLV